MIQKEIAYIYFVTNTSTEPGIIKKLIDQSDVIIKESFPIQCILISCSDKPDSFPESITFIKLKSTNTLLKQIQLHQTIKTISNNYKKICIVVGNLMKRKNPFEIIHSFKRLNLEADLVFVGEGVLMAQCIEVAKGHDNIKILGNKRNVAEYLQISDYFLSAAIAEGLPNAVIEAMAVGLPVILSNIPAHCELFSEDYIGFFNLGELKDDFQIILNNLIKNYGQISQQMIAESIKFSAKKMSFEYQQLYQSLVG